MSGYTGFEIAVIGISGRFPGAENLNAFWDNLKNGVESIRFFGDKELLEEGEEKNNLKNPLYVKANGYLKSKGYFDSSFFNYTPNEAKLMDPQMRILHECVWQAIEDAGYNVFRYKDRIGLFAGATTNINWMNYAKIANLRNLVDNYSMMLLSNIDYGNTRVSYSEYIGIRGERGELKHLSTRRKGNQPILR